MIRILEILRGQIVCRGRYTAHGLLIRLNGLIKANEDKQHTDSCRVVEKLIISYALECVKK